MKPILPSSTSTGHNPGRRRFLTLGAGALVAAGSLAAMPGVAKAASKRPERSLSIYNLHTGEGVDAVYWAEGGYIEGGVAEISQLMRDFRTGEVKAIDPHLLDLLYAITGSLGATGPIHLISGYRSAGTNARLHERSSGVAKHSLHMDGMAGDIRIPGHDLGSLHKVALSLRGGGVGYYPQSDFVHVDVGAVRRWRGA